jgi:hypothetical protein
MFQKQQGGGRHTGEEEQNGFGVKQFRIGDFSHAASST